MIYKKINDYKMGNVDITIAEMIVRWNDAREKIDDLEKQIKKYKQIATKYMDDQGKNSIVLDDFVLKKRKITKRTISKKDVPENIWEKYSKETSYDAFYLTDNR
jgi:hypothetical protein